MRRIEHAEIIFVGGNGDTIRILKPPKGRSTKEEALNLAAWLVVLADDSLEETEFHRVLLEVKNT